MGPNKKRGYSSGVLPPSEFALEPFGPALDQLDGHYFLRCWVHVQWRRDHRHVRGGPGHGGSAEVRSGETTIEATRQETRKAAAGQPIQTNLSIRPPDNFLFCTWLVGVFEAETLFFRVCIIT